MDKRSVSFSVVGVLTCLVSLALLSPGFAAEAGRAAVTLPNPILFVTQVPIPLDTSTITSPFGNHRSVTKSCGRGGDLYILYTDGTLKNLTSAAGFGNSGLQGSNGIAVREPSMSWDGSKALFSMVVGSPASQSDSTQFFWQIYEVTGLGELQTPSITKVPHQPPNSNNINPIYGTDGRIIFSSDLPYANSLHLFPQYDEYRGELSNSGMYSLDPSSGDLKLIDHAPSGDFRPFIDSYGRVIFSRWDHLQRDGNADVDVMNGNTFGSFNYSDESAGASVLAGDRTEYYPEPQSRRTDLLAGTNMIGFEFNHFIPWQMNEDGTDGETMNHVGRHDLNQGFGRSFNDDPNLVNFSPSPTRTNQNSILNMIQVVEDPTTPGRFYGVDCLENGTHGAGQIITLAGAPSLDAQDMFVTYVTDRSTAFFLPENGTPNATYTGHYRNPLPLSDGTLLTVHVSENRADKNSGNYSNPVSRYDFRISTMQVRTGSILMANAPVTPGIPKSVSYYGDSGLVSFSGTLWELDPVEVKARPTPSRRVSHIGSPELQIFSEEGVDTTAFRNYLSQHDLAVIVSRNVTNRNTDDHQQPFYLKIHNSATQSPNPSGKVYDVKYLQLEQARYLRGYGLVNGHTTPLPGRRVLPYPLNGAPYLPSGPGPQGSVTLGSDGSMAAMIPAHRATAWQLLDSAGTPVVRERFWVTFQPGEVRTCASCHGSNGEAAVPKQIIPQNKPEALRSLLQYWKNTLMASAPAAPSPVFPANYSLGKPLSLTALWGSATSATSYRMQLSTDSTFATTSVDDSTTDSSRTLLSLIPSTVYFWRVRAANGAGPGPWSPVWRFTTQDAAADQFVVSAAWNLLSLPFAVADGRKSSVFPSAVSRAFVYSAGYKQSDTLVPGVGYWVKFPGSQSVQIDGTPFSAETLAVTRGWNMIGSTSNSMSVSSVTSLPPGIMESVFFGYSGAYYVTDSLRPSHGYWIKVSQDGELVANGSASAPKQTAFHPPQNVLLFSDGSGHTSRLYFGRSSPAPDAPYGLPPLPPQGGFDVRFASQRMVALIEDGMSALIDISSPSFPVTLRWDVLDEASLTVDGREIPLAGSGECKIASPSVTLHSPVRAPQVFSLHQNYPNPFNPSTTIAYDLPYEAHVKLTVSDVLGRQVEVLVDADESSGFKSVAWAPGESRASGVYYYRIDVMPKTSATRMVRVGKALILK